MLNLKNKKILITGGQGFVGKHLVENLVNVRKVPRKNIFAPSSSKLNLVDWDNCVKAVRNKDVVIHLAAKVGGIGLNKEKPGELFYDNLVMGAQIMEASRQAKVKKFVGIGTICAYPKLTPIPFKEKDLWDGYPEETNAPYGLAKKMLLVQSQAYRQQYGFNSICLLPVNMYGPGDNFDPKTSHVIPALVKKVADAKRRKKPFVEVWGSGKATREFLYVDDAVEGILRATERYDKSEPVNLGASNEISINKLVQLICKLMEYDGSIHWDKSKPDGQPRRKLNVAKAQAEFGFKAKTTFKKGLIETIGWYLKNQN